ncbi:MAG: TldD/PmbA family protein [Candidatus Cloacimonadales bacterium]|nr:TldD/PmbA family protein [Candidatus Cloacimonadales bacterium]
MYNQEFKFIFDYAKDKTDDIEILLNAGTSFSTKINEQEIESFNYSEAKGLSVKVILGGKAGYAYTEKFTEEDFKMIVDEAIENAKCSEDDEVVVMENYPDIDCELKLYNAELDKVSVERKIQLAKDLEKYAKAADRRVFNVPYAVFSDSKGYVKIANSKGLNKEENQNYAFAFVGALSQEKEEKRGGFEFEVSKDFAKFDAKKMAETSVKRSTDLLGGEPVESGSYPIVFNEDTMATMLATFTSIFYADAVQEGRSMLAGKMGQKIANNKVTITDDALHPEGSSTRKFDSEGYPSQTTILIDKGILKTYLHNTKTARKDGVRSTGHGSRGYKNSLGISSTNFILKPGELKENELFQQHDKIIEIVSLQGMHSGANTISGDFSLSGEGFLYENGKRKHSLKQFTVSGNFLKMLQDVKMIADNFRFNSSAIGTASVLIKELAISG